MGAEEPLGDGCGEGGCSDVGQRDADQQGDEQLVGLLEERCESSPRLALLLGQLEGGGGRPDFAEAGGRDATRIDELLARAPDVLQSLLASPSSELR